MSGGPPGGADLVYLAPHRWETIRQRAQHLTMALSVTHRVLYVEPAALSLAGNLRRLASGERAASWLGQLVRRGEHLWVYTPPPLLPLTMDFAQVNDLVHRLTAPLLRRVLVRLGFTAPIVVAGWPLAGAWLGGLGERAVVYDCMDDFPAFPQARRRRRLLAECEEGLAGRAALVTVTSEPLAAKWRSRGRPVGVVPNAVTAAFVAAGATSVPSAELAALPGPRLLYIGALGGWFDETTVAHVARRHPEWSFALVGPLEVALPALGQLPNVHLLGPRPHEALPGLLAAADACLIPFTVSPLTVAVNPVKLYEYLAAGKPVVSSALPEVERYAAVCYLASDGPSFARAAELALREAPEDPRRARRRQIAAENTWAHRAATFDDLLGRYCAAPRP